MMFTVRTNVLCSAIAIAFSSLHVEPTEAGESVKVTIQGTDYSRGKTYDRIMSLEFGDTAEAPVITKFPGDTSVGHSTSFYSSQLEKHGYQLEVATSQLPDGTAQSYTSLLTHQGKVFAQLKHELPTGVLSLSVDKVFSRAAEAGHTTKNVQANPLTGACHPAAFGELLEIYSDFFTATPLTGSLEELKTYNVDGVTVEKAPFLRQRFYGVGADVDPGTMHLDAPSIFPDPEQSLSLIATTLLHSARKPEDFDLNQVVNALQKTSPLVSIVTHEQRLAAEKQKYAGKVPVIALSGQAGELLLPGRQINPAAAIWLKSATSALHDGADWLQVTHALVPELREACYQAQASIIRRVAGSGEDISDNDIGSLSHYQQLISILDYVIDSGNDLTLTKAMLQHTHINIGRGTYLKVLLADQFAEIENIKTFVHSGKFSQRLQTTDVDCCEMKVPPVNEGDVGKLVRHQLIASNRALQNFFTRACPEGGGGRRDIRSYQ